MPRDAVDENKITLCCAACCVNCGIYEATNCSGCSGKVGCCCCQAEVCFKLGAPCLPCICCGPAGDCNDCGSLFDAQCEVCGLVVDAAFPCNEDVPLAVTILGLTLFPKVGACLTVAQIKR